MLLRHEPMTHAGATLIAEEEPVIWSWISQNAAAIQACCAVFAFIGLIVYVLDTRRIRKDQERTNRASLTPFLTVAEETYGANPPFTDKGPSSHYSVQVIRNVGTGTALRLTAWCRPVPHDYKLKEHAWIEGGRNEHSTVIRALQLMSGEQTEVTTAGFTFGLQFLTVVEAEDQRGARHQLHILLKPDYERAVARWYTRD